MVAWLATFLLLVSIEVIEEQVVVLYSVVKVIHHLLLFVNLDAEATSIIENIFLLIDVSCLPSETASPRQDELSFSLECVFHSCWVRPHLTLLL